MKAQSPNNQITHSNQILRKIQDLRNGMDGPSLNEYLPKQRINSSMSQDNTQSHRKSLQKRLQRMFRQQRQDFIQNTNQSYLIPSSYPQDNAQNRRGYSALTADRMQLKIKQLEKKYLKTNETAKNMESVNKKNQTLINASKKQQTKHKKQSSYQINRYKDDGTKKLLKQVNILKKQINDIKHTNAELSQKFEIKADRKAQKQKSKHLLNQILIRIIKIQTEVQIKDRITNKNTQKICKYQAKEDPKKLLQTIEELKKQLQKQTLEKQTALEKNRWIEQQLRALNQL